MLAQSDIDDLIRAVYRCGTDPARWVDFVAELDRKLDSVYLSIYGHDTTTNVYLGALISKYDDHHMERYASGLGERNPFLPVLMQAEPMDMQPSETWVERGDLEQSEFYSDFLQPQEDIVAGGGGVIFNDDERMLIMSGQVRRKDEGFKVDELIGTLRRLAPHVREAFSINRDLSGRTAHSGAYLKGLNELQQAIFVLDAIGRPRHRNTAAEKVLSQGSLCFLNSSGMLRFRDTATQREVEFRLGLMTSGLENTVPGRGVAVAKSGRRHLYTLAPLEITPETWFPLPAFTRRGEPMALLIIRGVGGVDRAAICDLCRDFGASPAEAALAVSLLEGRSLNEHADERGISVHTVRAQMKALFHKTGTGRQAELVNLLHRHMA